MKVWLPGMKLKRVPKTEHYGEDIYGRRFYFTEEMAKRMRMPSKGRQQAIPPDRDPYKEIRRLRLNSKRYEQFFQKARIFFLGGDRGLSFKVYEVEGKYVAIHAKTGQERFIEYAFLAAGLEFKYLDHNTVLEIR